MSTLWLQRNFNRSQSIYQRESLTGSLRRQLQKLATDWSQFLEGRSLDDLATAEVYVLAKVLPGFNRQSRLQVYQGVLQEALTEGRAKSATSLELLQGMREELQVTAEEHYSILDSLGVEDPNLLDPQLQRSREDRLRLDSYQQNLENLLMALISSGGSIEQALQQQQAKIEAMRQEYSVTTEEQEQVLLALFHPNGTLLETSAKLLKTLQLWSSRDRSIIEQSATLPAALYKILHSTVSEHQYSIATQLFSILEILAADDTAAEVATTLGYLAPAAVKDLLILDRHRLSPKIREILTTSRPLIPATPLPSPNRSLDATILGSTHTKITTLGNHPIPTVRLVDVLVDLLAEVDPLVKAVSLHAIEKIDTPRAEQVVKTLDGDCPKIVQELVDRILKRPLPTRQIPTLTIDLTIYDRQERHIYSQPTISLGRAATNDITILDNQISRQHALFKIDNRGIILRDLGSTNGLLFGNTTLKNAEQSVPNGTKIVLCQSNDITVTVNWSIVDRAEDGVTTVEKLLWLSTNQLFQSCSYRSLLDLAQSSTKKIFDRGDLICETGQPAHELILPIAGTVSINEKILGAGSVIGESAILSKTLHNCTAIAHSPKVPALIISTTNFNELLERDPRIARTLLAAISQRVNYEL